MYWCFCLLGKLLVWSARYFQFAVDWPRYERAPTAAHSIGPLLFIQIYGGNLCHASKGLTVLCTTGRLTICTVLCLFIVFNKSYTSTAELCYFIINNRWCLARLLDIVFSDLLLCYNYVDATAYLAQLCAFLRWMGSYSMEFSKIINRNNLYMIVFSSNLLITIESIWYKEICCLTAHHV